MGGNNSCGNVNATQSAGYCSAENECNPVNQNPPAASSRPDAYISSAPTGRTRPVIDIGGWLQRQPIIVRVPVGLGFAVAGCGGGSSTPTPTPTPTPIADCDTDKYFIDKRFKPEGEKKERFAAIIILEDGEYALKKLAGKLAENEFVAADVMVGLKKDGGHVLFRDKVEYILLDGFKNVTIEGRNPADQSSPINRIISDNEQPGAFLFKNCQNVTLKNATILSAAKHKAIMLQGGSTVTVSNVTLLPADRVPQYETGIEVSEGSSLTIDKDVKITTAKTAVHVTGSKSQALITNTTVENAADSTGFLAENDAHLRVTDVSITGGKIGVKATGANTNLEIMGHTVFTRATEQAVYVDGAMVTVAGGDKKVEITGGAGQILVKNSAAPSVNISGVRVYNVTGAIPISLEKLVTQANSKDVAIVCDVMVVGATTGDKPLFSATDSTVELIDSAFHNNEAGKNADVILAQGGSFKATRLTMANNRASADGTSYLISLKGLYYKAVYDNVLVFNEGFTDFIGGDAPKGSDRFAYITTFGNVGPNKTKAVEFNPPYLDGTNSDLQPMFAAGAMNRRAKMAVSAVDPNNEVSGFDQKTSDSKIMRGASTPYREGTANLDIYINALKDWGFF